MEFDRASGAESPIGELAPQGSEPATEEQVLLAAVLRKDRKATAEFVARYADHIHGYVRQRLAPRADLTEDLVQEVFLVAFRKLDTFTGHSSDRKSTRLNSSHIQKSRMPSSA